MSALFSNGTEWEAWEAVWCAVCAHDHDAGCHGAGCEVVLELMSGDHPEVIRAEPAGERHLPALHVCTLFTPCSRPGCSGDPFATERARTIEHLDRQEGR